MRPSDAASEMRSIVRAVDEALTPDVVMLARIHARHRWHWAVMAELRIRLALVLFAREWANFVSPRAGKRLARWAAEVPVPRKYR